jgi:hypothetical protein
MISTRLCFPDLFRADSRLPLPWDYFRFARHSTRSRGSAAWIRDFHEETSSPEDILRHS